MPKQTAPKQTWYNIAASDVDTTDVMLYGDIGAYAITAAQFARDFNAIATSKINLHINSGGGEIMEGLAIANTIKNHKAEVTCYIDSVAASIASVVAIACDKVVIASNAYIMIHNGRATFAFGDSADLRRQADLLDKLTGGIAQAYADKSGKPVDDIKQKMADETWFDAAEALDYGLADEISEEEEEEEEEGLVDSAQILAALKFAKVPTKLRSLAAQWDPAHPKSKTPLNKEAPMPEKVIVRDNKHFVKVGDKEVELELPAAGAAENSAQKAPAADPGAKTPTQIAQEAVTKERAYRADFNTAVASANLTGEAATQFEKSFYGRDIEDVKFLASMAIGARAKPVGEGAADPEKKADDVETAAATRFAAEASLRMSYGVNTTNASDPVYKAALTKYVASCKRWEADQAAQKK